MGEKEDRNYLPAQDRNNCGNCSHSYMYGDDRVCCFDGDKVKNASVCDSYEIIYED